MGAASSSMLAAARRRPFLILLGALMVASAAWLIHYRVRLGFFLDDWQFVIGRHGEGIGNYLDPHQEHIVVIPVAIYKLFLNVFGMGTPMPLQIFSILVFLLAVAMLFLYTRPMVGEPAAVIGCAVVLFLGIAWEDLLFAFQLGFSICIATGIAALIMLRRNDASGDRWACALLVIATLTVSLGVPFIVGAAAEVLLRRDRVRERVYVFLVPLGFYALWWLGWGHTADNVMSASNALDAPNYVYHSFETAVSALTGSFEVSGATGRWLGHLTAIAVLAGTGLHLYRKKALPRPLLVAAAIALTFWTLAALNQLPPGRNFDSSRYQFPGVVFLLMMLAGAFEGARIRPRVLIALGVVAVVASIASMSVLQRNYENFYKPIFDSGMATLTGVDIARGTVSPGYQAQVTIFNSFSAGEFFDAEDRYGDIGWSETGIADSDNTFRTSLDQVLIDALPVSTRRVKAGAGDRGCVEVDAGPGVPTDLVTITGESFTVRSRGAYLTLGRFGDGAPNGVTAVPRGSKTTVRIPGDRSGVPWRAGFVGEGTAEVCQAN